MNDDRPWIDPDSDAPDGLRELLQAAHDVPLMTPAARAEIDAWLGREAQRQKWAARRRPLLQFLAAAAVLGCAVLLLSRFDSVTAAVARLTGSKEKPVRYTMTSDPTSPPAPPRPPSDSPQP